MALIQFEDTRVHINHRFDMYVGPKFGVVSLGIGPEQSVHLTREQIADLRDFLNENMPAVAPVEQDMQSLFGDILDRLSALEDRVAELEPAEVKVTNVWDNTRTYKEGETIVVDGVTWEARQDCEPQGWSSEFKAHKGRCWRQVS